jgi:hypothetical protein
VFPRRFESAVSGKVGMRPHADMISSKEFAENLQSNAANVPIRRSFLSMTRPYLLI